MITYERLIELLDYNHETGLFVWKETRNHLARKGDIAGHAHKGRGNKTYIIIVIDGNHHYAQKLAYLYHFKEYPSTQMDHINGDSTDNRISNLRKVNCKENQRNARLRSDNKIGLQGVNLEKSTGKYVVRISTDGGRLFLGRYDTIFEAACVRKSAERKHGFHLNHGRRVDY